MSDLAVSDDLRGPVFKLDQPSGSLGATLARQLEQQLPEAIKADEADRALKRRAATSLISEMDRAGEARKEARAQKPPVPPPQPPPQFQATSPVEQWGSMAMGMAMLGSAFTKRPAINALNAAAGVMNAYHDRDAEAYKRNFDHWKATSEYSLKMYEYQREAYRDALSDIDSDVNLAMQKFRVVASAFGDDKLSEFAKLGNAAAVLQTLKMGDFTFEKTRLETDQLKRHGELLQRGMDAASRLQANPADLDAKRELQEVQQLAAVERNLKSTGSTVAEQQFQHQQDLEKSLTDEWVANNPGKELTASIKADIAAKAKGSALGHTEKATDARERMINAAVEADVEKFHYDHPGASDAEIAKERYDSYLSHTGEMGRAVRQPRNASAMSLDTFVHEYKQQHDGRAPSSAEIQTFQAVGAGKSQEARTIGVRSAAIELASEVADSLIPLVKETSAQINRTKYPDLNKIILAYEQRTGDPKVVQFGEMVNSLRYAYARALSPTGQARVDDLRRADAILDPAWSKGQINAALDQIHRGIQVEKGAIERVRQRIAAGGASSETAAPPPTAAAPDGVPAGLPDPAGHADGTTAKDKSGKVVAIIRAGKWVAP